MRRADQEHSSYVVLKPATAAIIVAFVGFLCVLSFAVGTTQAKAGMQIPVLNATPSDAEIGLDATADNVVPGTDSEAVKVEATQLAHADLPGTTETELAESSSASEAPARDSQAKDEWETIRMRVTAYCPCPKCCGEHSDGITACGHKIEPGDCFVAADRRFAFYTDMVIEGYGNSQPVKVLDRGGAIKGNKLDVFFMTHQEALEWGVRYIDVKVRCDKASS
jgi:3D (Asp-Asp-Asp) domain-containing protein